MTDRQALIACDIADYYGFGSQKMIFLEELSELQKAICKFSRGAVDHSIDIDPSLLKYDLIEEMADVAIMTKQIMHLTGISDNAVNNQIEIKLARQQQRMGVECFRMKSFDNK